MCSLQGWGSPAPCQGHQHFCRQQHNPRQLFSPLSTLDEAQAKPRVGKTRSTSCAIQPEAAPAPQAQQSSPRSQGTGLRHQEGHKPAGLQQEVPAPQHRQDTETADKPYTVHSISGDTNEPHGAPKDTVMRNPPKRNMKTKSAVLPRKEPSSSMRQYLYLRAGEKGGAAVKEINSWPPCAPQQDFPGKELLQAIAPQGAQAGVQAQNSANFTSHY